jgi:outer membrane biosynthesis protein TonB
MARNWTVAEATKVICDGKKKAEMMDIGRRFPLLSMAIASGLTPKMRELFESMPEWATARKFDAMLKEGVEPLKDEEDGEDEPAPKKKVVEEPAPAPKKKKVVEEEDDEPKPKKKKVVVEDDEDDEPKPKKKAAKKDEDWDI